MKKQILISLASLALVACVQEKFETPTPDDTAVVAS